MVSPPAGMISGNPASFMTSLLVFKRKTSRAGASTRSFTVTKVLEILGSSSHRLPSQSLLKSLLGNADLWSVHAIQWGVQHEEMAIEEYEVSKGVPLTTSGLWLSASGLIGACPDGLVGHDWAFEVKCPDSVRSTSLLERAKDKKPFFIALRH